MRYIFFIITCLLFFSCNSKVTEDNLEKIFSSEKSEIWVLKSHGNITGEAYRSKSKEKFEISNINDILQVKYYVSAFHNDSLLVFDLTEGEIDYLKLILKEAIRFHDYKKEYDGCCMCSNLDFLLENEEFSFEIKPTGKSEYLYLDVVRKYQDELHRLGKLYAKKYRNELKERERTDSIQKIIFKNKFINLFNENDVLSIIDDTLNFSFDFNLHGFDCGAPDCYSTFVDFSFPMTDSIIFPLTLDIKEYTAGACMEAKAPKYHTFFLAENSNGFLIYNSRGARKSLVLNTNNENFDNKAYYFSSINYPINLKNVEGLLLYNENTKESEMPFTSTSLAEKI